MDLLINYGIQSTLRQITETPTINFVSKSDSTIVFTITNNDLKLATIYWELDNPTPTLNSLILPEGTTSNEITVTGLSVGSLYTIYVRAKASAKLESSVASMTQTIESSELIPNQLPYVGRNGGTTSATSPFPVGGRYFTNANDFVLPNYPQYMNLYGPPPTGINYWYTKIPQTNNTDPNWFTNNNLDFIGESFSLRFTGTLPHTTNSCATAANVGFFFEDGTGFRVVGTGGNKSGCAGGGCGAAAVPCSGTGADGSTATNLFRFNPGVSFTIEQTTDLKFKVNGTTYKTGGKLILVRFYAGYTGTTSNSSNAYKIFGTIDNVFKTG